MDISFFHSPKPEPGSEFKCAFCERPTRVGERETVVEEKKSPDDPDSRFAVSYRVSHRDCLDEFYDSQEE